MPVTKSDVAVAIQERVGFTRKRAGEITETILDLMKESFGRGETVKISGFGNFEVRTKTRRRGRNPQTGEDVIISARRVLTFKPSLVLKNTLNQ